MLPAILAALGEAGAASGAAAGGASAASGISGSIGSLGGVASQAQGAVGKLTSGMGQMGQAVGKLQSVLNFVPNKILEVQHLITSTADLWVHALAAPATTIKQLGDSISGFVKLYNPATAKMFEFKIENTFATIGKALEPILQALTRSAEKVGDAFAKLGPALDAVIKPLSEVIDAMTGEIVPAARELAPYMKLLGGSMRDMASSAKLIIGPFTSWLRLMNSIPGSLGSLGAGGFDESAVSSTAAREPKYTSAEDLQRELAKNALQASAGGGQPKKDAPSWLEQIYGFLEKRLSVEAALNLAKAIGQEIKNNLPDVPSRNDIGDRTERNIPGVRGSILGGILGWSAH